MNNIQPSLFNKNPTLSSEKKVNKVSEILNQKQLNKTFKDVGDRVSGSKKELAAYRMIEIGNLQKLEIKDPLAAAKLVKKDKVIEKFVPKLSKSTGESAGVVFLKSRIYRSIKSTPIDNKEARESYVTLLPVIWNEVKKARTLEDIEKVGSKLEREQNGYYVTDKYFFDGKEFIAKETIGESLTNLLRRRNSESAMNNWHLARKYQEDNDWSFLDKEKKTSTISNKPRLHSYAKLSHITREGGRQVTDAEVLNKDTLITDFGYKSIQLGNYMDDISSRESIKNYIGAMKDLEDVLELDISSMNKESGLSIAFGARGSGSAMAHYEPGYNIINLTKAKGDGSVAHEWGHFLDYYLGKKRGGDNLSTTEQKVGRSRTEQLFTSDPVVESMDKLLKYIKENPRQEVTEFNGENCKYSYSGSIKRVFDRDGLEAVIKYISPYKKHKEFSRYAEYVSKLAGKPIKIPMEYKGTKFYGDALSLGEKYWGNDKELFARAFASYIDDSLEEKGMKNNYLVSDTKQAENEYHVHPLGEERIMIHKLIGDLIENIKKEQ